MQFDHMLDINTLKLGCLFCLFCLVCLFVSLRLLDHASPNRILSIVKKSLVRKGAWAWFCRFPTHGEKVIEIQSSYG